MLIGQVSVCAVYLGGSDSRALGLKYTLIYIQFGSLVRFNNVELRLLVKECIAKIAKLKTPFFGLVIFDLLLFFCVCVIRRHPQDKNALSVN